jgi:hypothetical protein
MINYQIVSTIERGSQVGVSPTLLIECSSLVGLSVYKGGKDNEQRAHY